MTVRFDDVELPRDDLASFFSLVSASYDLPRFEYHPEGGATFSSSEGSEFVIKPGHAACGGVTRLGSTRAWSGSRDSSERPSSATESGRCGSTT